MSSTPSAAPLPGFVVKLSAPDGTRHYANLCSHSAIQRPLDGRDKEVDDGILRTRGIDNLRVPLLISPVRTVALAGGEEEAVCFDVIFSTAVLAVALPGGTAEEANSAAAANGIDPALSKMVRIRLVELALSHAEQDLGYKLGRNFTLPKAATYKGGVSGGRQPVPCNALRNLIAAQEAAQQQQQEHASAGPWRSRREAAGQTTRPKIQELASFEDEPTNNEPLLKKGFLAKQSAKGRHLYPDGSEEGLLYGDIKTAGDPLGYLPKGLRSRVNVVDTGSVTEQQQQKMMEDYASGRKVTPPGMPPAPPGTTHPGGASGSTGAGAKGSASKGAGDLSKGFLNSSAGALYPDGSTEGGGKSEMDALRELIPTKTEMESLAESTDTDTFLKELSAMGSLLGLEGVGGGGASSGGSGGSSTAGPGSSPIRQFYETGHGDPESGGVGDATGDERVPEYEFAEAGDADQAVVLKVKLPELASLAEAEVDTSDESFSLVAKGLYRLELKWPRPVCADDAKAKFLKKSRTLQVTVPPAAV